MTALNLIGLGGLKESGKDSAAEALVDELGWRKDSVSLAIDSFTRLVDPFVDIAPNRPPMRYSQYVDEACKGNFDLAKQHPEVRRVLQAVGSAVRTIDPEAWSSRAEQRMLETLSAGGRYALTGVRFQTEIEVIRRHGGLLVWVSRPDHDDHSDTDVTENSVGPEDFDIVIVNDGTLEELRAQVLDLARSVVV